MPLREHDLFDGNTPVNIAIRESNLSTWEVYALVKRMGFFFNYRKKCQ
jgi:hypothetical protein